MIPTKANCDAPVNMNSDSICVCQTSRPVATEMAPKERAYAPVAIPMEMALP